MLDFMVKMRKRLTAILTTLYQTIQMRGVHYLSSKAFMILL